MTDHHLSQTANSVLAATAGVTGDAFFAAVSRTIAESLGVRWAFIGELVGPTRVRSIKGWDGGKPMPAFEYELKGTPCESVVGREACMFPCGVADMFPEDQMLTDMGAESYFGIPVQGSDGKPLGLIAALHDSTKFDSQDYQPLLEVCAMRVAAEMERQRLEKQLMHSQKLESLGMLAGGIAHDFNNLLVGILGNIENAEAALGEDAPDIVQPLADAREAAKAAAELTQQLLAYAGKQDTRPQPLAIDEHVRTTAKFVQRMLEGGVHLVVDVPYDMPCVIGDPAQLRQVLLNLLTNANDALDGGAGEIYISARIARPNAADYTACRFRSDRFNSSSAHIAIEVRDTGVGMDAESIQHIFDPFWSSKSPGRGLGLSAVLGILRTHCGAIQVSSSKGEGTTFTVYLPVTRKRPEQPGESPEPTPTKQALRVLIIDDNDIVRSTLARTLARLGCEATSCASGEQGVEAYQQDEGRFDGVIVDKVMPGMTGPEVIAKLHELGTDTPIVLTTGYDESGQNLEAGAIAAVLPKPWTTDDVSRLVRETFARS